MNDFYDSRWIFKIISKRFFHFVVIGIIAVIASAIFTGPAFITPKYKSTVRIYPSNLGEMSEESPTEQMLEILNSTDIKLRMVKAFNLGEVYKINPADPNFRTYVLGEYGQNVSANKTEFETVKIDVLDKDPIRAAQMCDSVIRFYNEKVREMHATKRWEVVRILENIMADKTTELDSLQKTVNNNRSEFQIVGGTAQIPEVTRGYMKALAEGQAGSQGGKTIRQIYQNLAEKGAEASIAEYRFSRSMRQLDSLKLEYEINLYEAKKHITYCHIVEKPMVADKKAYPVRWVIVAFTTLSSLFLALLVFVFLEYKKEN